MTTKQRIAQLEKNAPKNVKCVVFWDACGNSPATFDGAQMTQAEAERKAAALPGNVQLIHVCREAEAERKAAALPGNVQLIHVCREAMPA